jgi:MoxR-like ATPase
MSLDDVGRRANAILRQVERAIVGKHDLLELVLVGLLADGHVLLEDFPGLAKTLIARSFASASGMEFSRVQFTPDLMPADITGSSVFDQRTQDFVFQPGPVFTNLLLGDEINRASPKTQAALLEAMQEGQVTTDGVSRPTPVPFLVIATQNPIEFEGTYPLPEAQLDRFLLRLSIGYPDADAEWEMLARRLERGTPEPQIEAVVDSKEFRAMQSALEGVYVAESVGRYIVDIVRSTRSRAGVEVGASPRGSLALLLAARAMAVLGGRDFVVPEDIKAVAVPALAHRIRLRPDLWVRGEKPDDAILRSLQEVPTPAGQDLTRG